MDFYIRESWSRDEVSVHFSSVPINNICDSENAVKWNVLCKKLIFGLASHVNRYQQQLLGFQIECLKLKCKNGKNKYLQAQKSLQISWKKKFHLKRTLSCLVRVEQTLHISQLCEWLWSQQDTVWMLLPIHGAFEHNSERAQMRDTSDMYPTPTKCMPWSVSYGWKLAGTSGWSFMWNLCSIKLVVLHTTLLPHI